MLYYEIFDLAVNVFLVLWIEIISIGDFAKSAPCVVLIPTFIFLQLHTIDFFMATFHCFARLISHTVV